MKLTNSYHVNSKAVDIWYDALPLPNETVRDILYKQRLDKPV